MSRSVLLAFPYNSSTPSLTLLIVSALPCAANCIEKAKDCLEAVSSISAAAISENWEMEASLNDSKNIPWK